MTILLQIFAFLFAIFFLVTIHEYGHFWTARKLGIKVLRFSIGFGKILWRFYDKKGTEYAISILPLGGYVKLLDSRECKIPPEEADQEFNSKPAWVRFLVLIAGPLTNWIVAVILFWLLFSVGITQIKPIIGQILPHSIAAQAMLQPGDQFIAIDDRPTPSWQKVFIALAYRLGEHGQMTMKVQRGEEARVHVLNLATWQVNSLNPNPLLSLGIKPYRPPIPPVITKVLANQAGAKAGLQVGDQVLAIENMPVKNWDDLINYIQVNPGKTVLLHIKRGARKLTLQLTIGKRYSHNLIKPIGFIGVAPSLPDFPKDMQFRLQYSPLTAGLPALREAVSFSIFNLVLLGKMLVGHISLQGLGGPITIFNSANVAFSQGVLAYLSFIAIFSTMLAIINILPIPGLDGGQIAVLIIEAIRGRSFSLSTQFWIYRIGLFLLAYIMIQALVNDVMRLY